MPALSLSLPVSFVPLPLHPWILSQSIILMLWNLGWYGGIYQSIYRTLSLNVWKQVRKSTLILIPKKTADSLKSNVVIPMTWVEGRGFWKRTLKATFQNQSHSKHSNGLLLSLPHIAETHVIITRAANDYQAHLTISECWEWNKTTKGHAYLLLSHAHFKNPPGVPFLWLPRLAALSPMISTSSKSFPLHCPSEARYSDTKVYLPRWKQLQGDWIHPIMGN